MLCAKIHTNAYTHHFNSHITRIEEIIEAILTDFLFGERKDCESTEIWIQIPLFGPPSLKFLFQLPSLQ